MGALALENEKAPEEILANWIINTLLKVDSHEVHTEEQLERALSVIDPLIPLDKEYDANLTLFLFTIREMQNYTDLTGESLHDLYKLVNHDLNWKIVVDITRSRVSSCWAELVVQLTNIPDSQPKLPD